MKGLALPPAQMGKMRRWYPIRGDTYRCMTSILSTSISANDATCPNQIPQEASGTEGQKRQRCVILVDDEFFLGNFNNLLSP